MKDVPVEPVSGFEDTPQARWLQLDEARRTTIERLHKEEEEHLLEVGAIQSQLNFVTKFFNRRLKSAQTKLAKVREQLTHKMYREHAELYRQVRESKSVPKDKTARVQKLMTERDRLHAEVQNETSRYFGRGRAKYKRLQEIQNRIDSPMYAAEVAALTDKQVEETTEAEEDFFEGPEGFYKRYTDYDLVYNFQRLERERKEVLRSQTMSKADKQATLDNIDFQVGNIKSEMNKRNMPDVDYAAPGALARVSRARTAQKDRARKEIQPSVTAVPMGGRPQRLIEEPVIQPASEEPEFAMPADEDEDEEDMEFDFSDEVTDPRIETEAGLEEKTKLEGWLELSGIDSDILTQSQYQDITGFKKFLLSQVKATDDPGRARALEESIKAWENYNRAKFGQKIERPGLPVPSAEEWAQEVKRIRAEADKGEKETAVKKEITDITAKMDDLRLTPEMGSKLEQLGNFVRDNEYNQANQLMNEVRDIIIGLKPDDKNLKAIHLFNDLRKQLLIWQNQ